MSRTVDERVVSMRFDNQQFEHGVKQTTSSLENFKKQFNFKQQESEFDRLQGVVNTFSLTHMASELSMLGDRFGLFGTIAGRVLENLVDKAMSTVHNLVNTLGIGFGGIKDGFAEYELQINSVQTMLANMSRESESTADTMSMSAARISSSLQEMATQVVRGNWGNGQDRIEALGQYYQQIQDAVNDAWAAGGKVASGWEYGLTTISGEIEIAAEDAAESIESIGNASMTAEERNRKNLEKIEHNLGILNEYADKTVYTFSDMTNAIGQFMTAGVDLDTSTTAIQGLSNIAAAFGVDNSRLKNTFYQLSQAINSGKVQLLDWRSVINANMSGPLFRDEIINTAKEMGALADMSSMSEKEIKAFKQAAEDSGRPVANLADVMQDFNGSLKDGWFTADILTAAISKFTGTGLAEYFEETAGVAKDYGEELINAYLDAKDATESQEALNKAIEEFSKSGQKSSKEVRNYLERLKNVSDAATKVKSATQLLQVIRESIGTGWADTFKILIGDFYEAQDLFTGISDKVGGFVGKIADARNQILKEWKEAGGRTTLLEALGIVFDFTDADSIIYNIIKPIKDAILEVFNLEGLNSNNLVTATERFKEIVQKIAQFIKDNYDTIKGIAKAILVFFKIKFTMFIAKVKFFLAILQILSPVLNVIAKLIGVAANALADFFNNKSGLGGVLANGVTMLKSFTGNLSDLANIDLSNLKLPDNLLSGVTELSNKLYSITGMGRTTNGFADSIKTLFGGSKETEEAITDAEGTVEDAQGVVDKTQELSDSIKATADDLKETTSEIATDGESAIGDALTSITPSEEEITNTKKSYKSAMKAVTEGTAVISATRDMTNKVSKVRDEISKEGAKTATSLVGKAAEMVVKDGPQAVQKAGKAISQSEALAIGFQVIKENFSKIAEVLKNFFYIDPDKFKERFGIDLKAKGAFWDILGGIYNWLKDHMSDILGLVKVLIAYKAVNGIVNIVNGFGGIFNSISSAAHKMGLMFNNIGKAAKTAAKAIKLKALGDMMLEIATGVGILVAAVAGLTAIPTEKLWPAIGALAAIVGIFVALTFAASKMKAIDTPKIASIAAFLITFGIAIGILVASIKSLSKMDPEQIKNGVIGVVSMIIALIGAVNLMKMGDTKHMNKVAGTILALSVAILILGIAIKSFAKMDPETFYSGLIRVAEGLLVISLAMRSIQSSAKENTKSAGTLIALALALLLLGVAIKKFAKIEPEVFYRGLVRVAAGLLVLTTAIKWMNKSSGATALNKGQKMFNPLTKTLLAMAAAMLILSLVLRIIADIPAEKAWPAFVMLSSMMLEMGLLAKTMMASAKYMNSGKGVASTLIGFAAALLVLSIIVKILGSIPILQAIQGIILLSILMAEMTYCFISMTTAVGLAGKDTKKAVAVLVAMAVVIAVLANVLSVLSTIDFAKGMAAVAELGILMGGIAALMFSIVESTKLTKAGDLAKGIILIGVMIAFVAALGLIIKEITNNMTNPEAAVPLVGAVDLLLAAMAGMLLTIAGVTKIGIKETEIKDVVVLLLALTGCAGALAGIIGAMSNLTNADAAVPLATAVSELLVAVVPLLVATAAIAKTGVNRVMIEASIEILAAAAILIGGMTTLFTAIGGIFNAIDEHFGNAATKGLEKGMEVINIIATGIGTAIGNFIAAISEGMLKAAENIAKGLEAVFGQIINLVEKLKGNVDENSVDLIKAVIKLIAVMTASDFINALTSWFTTKVLGQKQSSIADRLSDLADGVQKLDEKTKNLDVSRVQRIAQVFDCVAHALEAIATLMMTQTINDILNPQFTIGLFGPKRVNALEKLADGIGSFVQKGFIPIILTLETIVPDSQVDAIQKKMETLGTFVESLKALQEILPETVSLKSLLIGKKSGDWGQFGEDLSKFISYMTQACFTLSSNYATDVDGKKRQVSNDDFNIAKERLEVISKFSDSFKAFDEIRGNTPSLRGFIFGDKIDWGTFGRDLKQFVVAMNDAVHTMTDDVVGDDQGNVVSKPDSAKFSEAVERLNTLQGFSTALNTFKDLMPNVAEITNGIVGHIKIGMTWAEFGTDLKDFVIGLMTIVNTLNEDETYSTDTDTLISTAVTRMTNLGKLAWPLSKFKELVIPAVGIINQIHQNLTGEGEWAKFGEDLEKFIKDIIYVAKILGDDGTLLADSPWKGVDDIDGLLKNVEKRAETVGKLGDALARFTSFIGAMSFAEGRGAIIRVLNTDGSEFIQSMSAIEQTVKDIPLLAQAIVDMAKTIELNKQMIDNLGDENSGTISRVRKLAEMAAPIADFIQAFINLDDSDSEKAGDNIRSILNAFSEVTDDTGKTSLAKFAGGLDEFVVELVTIGQRLILSSEAVTKAIDVIKAIGGIDFNGTFADSDVFNQGIADMASALRVLGSALSDDNVQKALESGGFSKLRIFADGMTEVLQEGVPTFETTGAAFNEALIEGFTSGGKGEKGRSIKAQLTDILLEACQNVKNYKEIYYGIFKDLGKYMVEGFANGFKDSDALAGIRSAAENMVKEAKEATENAAKVESPSKVMQAVGKYLPLGFAKGIGDRTSLDQVKKSAIAMANTAKTATMKYLEIHSPSKVMETLGQYTIQGFINGIQNGLPKVQEIAKMLSESINKIPPTINGEDFANKVLGNVSKVAVAGISNAMMQASDGTMSFEEATKNATNSVFQFATALYAETDAAKSAQEELANLEEQRQELLKKQEENNKKMDEATARRAKAQADEVEYRKTHIDDELAKIEDDHLRTVITDKLNRYQDITEKLRDTSIVDFDKKKLEEEQKEIDSFLDAILEGIDDTKSEGQKSARDLIKEIITAVKEGHATIGEIFNENEENIKSIGEEGKSIGDEIIAKNEEIAKKNEEIVKDILQQWVDYRNKIRDTVKSFLSIFSGNALKIDLFSEFQSLEEKYQEGRKDKLSDVESQQKSVSDAESELAEADKELAAAKQDLADAQARSDAVQGKSLIALNQIEEANNRITEAEKKRAEAQKKVAEAQQEMAESQKALADYDYENSAEGIAKNMVEGMEKNISAYQTYQQQLKSLYDFGINKTYLDELKANGMSSAEQVAKLFAAASSEVMGEEFKARFNDALNKQREIERETYKQSLAEKANRAKEWAADVAYMKKAGLNKDLINEIVDQGPDNSTVLDMIKEEQKERGDEAVQEWNQLYEDLNSTSESIADAITAAMTAESAYADRIVAAILQANAGNMSLDIRGQKLSDLLSNDSDMRASWGAAYKEGLAKWDTLSAEEQKKNISRVAYASKLAADTVNLAVNKLNKETNGAYAIQNGLIDVKAFTQATTESFTKGADTLTTAVKESNAEVIPEVAATTAETVSTALATVATEQIVPTITENQTQSFEELGKLLDTLSKVYTRMLVIKAAIVTAIAEHLNESQLGITTASTLITENIIALNATVTAATNFLATAIAMAVQQVYQTGYFRGYDRGFSDGASAANPYGGTVRGPEIQRTSSSLKQANFAGTAVGKAYGKGIADGTKSSLGIKSPSKVFMAIGKFVDLGFAQGVRDNTPKVAAALSALTDINTDSINSLLDFSGIQNGNLLDLSTTRAMASGINPNTTTKLEDAIRALTTQQPAAGVTDNSTQNNTFNITGSDPREIANQVNVILQKKAVRRRESWA